MFFALAAGFTLLSGWRVFVAALVLAFPVRLAYFVIRRRARVPLLSGWIFVIALGLLVIAWGGANDRHVRRANSAAVRQGVVAHGAAATPRERCLGVYLDWWDKDGARRNRALGWTKADFRLFATRLCRRAETEHALRGDGSISAKALHRIWYAVG